MLWTGDSMKQLRSILAVPLLLLIIGCGPKPPRPGLPEDVSIVTALSALERQSQAVESFFGWAKVRLKNGGDEQSSTAVVRYMRPDRYRVNILGFGGVEIAEIGSDGDSVTVYIPHYEAFIRVPRGENPLAVLMPELDVDFNELVRVVEGVSLPPEPFDRYHITMRSQRYEAEMELRQGDMLYRYRLSGPDLTVVEESAMLGDRLLWQIVRSDFGVFNGIRFPRRVQIRDEQRSIRLDFSSISLNAGLSEEDVTVTVPDAAERLTPRN